MLTLVVTFLIHNTCDMHTGSLLRFGMLNIESNARGMSKYLDGRQLDVFGLQSFAQLLHALVGLLVGLLVLLVRSECIGLRLLVCVPLLCQGLLQARHKLVQVCSRKCCTRSDMTV